MIQLLYHINFSGCYKDETLVKVDVLVSYRQIALASHFAYQQTTTIEENFRFEHNRISVGLSLGGAKEAISAALGLHVQKTLDTVSASKKHVDVRSAFSESFQLGFVQLYRIIKTTITINGYTATTDEETYVDVVNDTNRYNPDELEEMARDYVKDHFGIKIPQNQLANIKKRFCTIGNIIYFLENAT